MISFSSVLPPSSPLSFALKALLYQTTCTRLVQNLLLGRLTQELLGRLNEMMDAQYLMPKPATVNSHSVAALTSMCLSYGTVGPVLPPALLLSNAEHICTVLTRDVPDSGFPSCYTIADLHIKSVLQNGKGACDTVVGKIVLNLKASVLF